MNDPIYIKLGLVFVVGVIIIFVVHYIIKKETFVKGRDYLIDQCLHLCEQDTIKKSVLFSPLTDGSRLSQAACYELCVDEYNKDYHQCDGKYFLDKCKRDCPRIPFSKRYRHPDYI